MSKYPKPCSVHVICEQPPSDLHRQRSVRNTTYTTSSRRVVFSSSSPLRLIRGFTAPARGNGCGGTQSTERCDRRARRPLAALGGRGPSPGGSGTEPGGGSGAASRTCAAQPPVHPGLLLRCRRLHGGRAGAAPAAPPFESQRAAAGPICGLGPVPFTCGRARAAPPAPAASLCWFYHSVQRGCPRGAR